MQEGCFGVQSSASEVLSEALCLSSPGKALATQPATGRQGRGWAQFVHCLQALDESGFSVSLVLVSEAGALGCHLPLGPQRMETSGPARPCPPTPCALPQA